MTANMIVWKSLLANW